LEGTQELLVLHIGCDWGRMAYETNKHVERLRQYIPFQPSHGQLYEEYVADAGVAPRVETKVLGYVASLLGEAGIRLIVLTGDAGHGKTHTCRRLLEGMGATPGDALAWLREKGDGAEPFRSSDGRSVRIVKDLSDTSVRAGVQVMLSAEDAQTAPIVVCANEGRVRDVVSASDGRLDYLRDALEQTTRIGTTCVRPGYHVINLNYQSVSSDHSGIVAAILKHWILDGRNWSTCKRCDAALRCPILFNRTELAGIADGDVSAEGRREALRLLVQVVEESGHVVTFRELLILSAYLLTGGLSCREVTDSVSRRRDDDWQYEFGYAQLLFAPPLSADQRKSFPVFDAIARLDPGMRANRLVDEPLAVEVVDAGGLFQPPSPGTSERAGARTRRVALEEASRMRGLMVFRRRRDFFELATNRSGESSASVSRPARLGLKYYDDFEFVRSRKPDRARTIGVRDRLITGLHAVQGMHVLGSGVVSLHLVDPAFARTEGAATIVARTVRATDVTIEPESEAWRRRGRTKPTLPEAIDWLDRRVVVRFGDGTDLELELDLLQFDYVMRAGEGLACRSFFRADIRRIMASLAMLVDRNGRSVDEISVLKNGRVQKIVIDQGLIRTGDA
jgi:hypothetical protein